MLVVTYLNELANFGWTDDPESFRDAPLSLQVVGKRYEDEKVFEALKIIVEAAGLEG